MSRMSKFQDLMPSIKGAEWAPAIRKRAKEALTKRSVKPGCIARRSNEAFTVRLQLNRTGMIRSHTDRTPPTSPDT